MTPRTIGCCVESCQDQPLLGTASHTDHLVVVDHPRAWPAKIQSVLPLSDGWQQQLNDWAARGQRWTLLARHTTEPARIHHFGWGLGERSAAIEAQDSLLQGEPVFQPMESRLLVCTHGSRDRCCAQLGVPLARELASRGLTTWEVSHIGGHRFAPTLWSLPSWRVYGRIPTDATGLDAWVDNWRHDRWDPSLRGHAGYDPRLQCVESELARLSGRWPTQLTRAAGQLWEGDVAVSWPDGTSETWRACWEETLYQGAQSCIDLPKVGPVKALRLAQLTCSEGDARRSGNTAR